MTHRLEVHPNKVKFCKDPENCTFKKCWFKHNENSIVIEENGKTPAPKQGNNPDFQNAPTSLKPPLDNQN